MKLLPDDRSQAIFDVIISCLPTAEPVYLVGGAVRDRLLGLQVNDLDFVVANNSLSLAKKVQRRLGAVGYTLDDERQTARLILDQGKPTELILDFVSFTGSNLMEDLLSRDFTINTLAIDLRQPDELVDLLGGERDLREKCLRAASARSMALDPLRVLRGVRLSLAYHLTIDSETTQLMRNSIANLKSISGERLRDEIFKIFEQDDLGKAFLQLDNLGLIDQLFPELSVLKQVPAFPPHVHDIWTHTLQVIFYLKALWDYFRTGKLPGANAFLRKASEALNPYALSLKELFSNPVQGNRSRWSLLLLAALYHDAGKPPAQTIDSQGKTRFFGHERLSAELVLRRAQELMLGRDEVDYLQRVVANHMRLHFFSKEGAELTDRACYRYFRDLGEAGVDVALLSLADLVAAYEDTLDSGKWERELNAALLLLNAWFSRREKVIAPTLLLNGDDLQREFGLEPGALIGKLLAELREAQAAGEIYSRPDAVKFVEQYLRKQENVRDL